MPIISIEIMKIIEERETKKETKKGKNNGDRTSSERVRAKRFCCAFNFYILQKSITSRNKKLLQKLLSTQEKKTSSLTWGCSLPNLQLTKLLLTSHNMNYYELVKFKNAKSWLPLKRFIILLLTTKIGGNQKSEKSLLILISTTTNLLHVYYVNIACYENLEKIKISL